jgi:peroxiredoxin
MSTSLASQLEEVNKGVAQAPENVREALASGRADAVEKFDPTKAIQPGEKLPEFSLSDATGKKVSSSDLLKKGAILIAFYRGEWCPYCNLWLRAFQKRLGDFEAKGVTFVAISPELPDTSLTNVEKNELAFPVLSDVDLSFARELGLVWKQPDALRPIFDAFGNDLKKRNGNDSFELPVPTVLLVDKSGTVKNVHTDADWVRRLDPQVTLDWANAL